MLLTPLTGVVISQNAEAIIVQEGDAVATYSRRFYRLPHDQDKTSEPIAISWTDPLPVELVYGSHAVLAPVYL